MAQMQGQVRVWPAGDLNEPRVCCSLTLKRSCFQVVLEKHVILRWGWSRYKMSLEHLTVPERKDDVRTE